MSANKKIILSLIAGLIFSGIALYVTFKNIPLQDLVGYLKIINYWWVIPAVAVGLMSFLIRVIRWQLLLSPVKETGFWSAFHPLMIGFMFNCIPPARVGELARPAIFYKKQKVAFSKVLATVGAERVFDILILLLFLVVVLANVEISPTLNLTFGKYHLNKATLETIGITTLKLSLVLIACIVLASVRQSHRIMRRLILGLPALFFFAGDAFREKIRERFCKKLSHIFDNFTAGLGLLRSPKKTALCFVLSLLVWALSGLSYYVLSYGCPGIEISFLEMCAVMVILCFFISLPSVPGFWGLWEAGGVFGLLIFGISAKEAAGFTLANHVFQMFPVIIVGLASSIITGVSIAQVARNTGVEPEPREKMS